MKQYFKLILIAFSIFGCKTQEVIKENPPSVITRAASDISFFSATLNGDVIQEGFTSTTDRGFEFSDKDILQSCSCFSDATIIQSQSGYGKGAFSAKLDKLELNTKYYYKAFATNTKGTSYGAIQSFKTSPPSGPVPTANFTYSGEVIAPSTITFNNSSSNATRYFWNIGNNRTSGEENPTHTFSQSGVYSVKLTATGSGGSSTITKEVKILSKPINFSIVSVKITAIPLTKINGQNWDVSPNSGPDVYFTIVKGALNVQYDSPFFIKDVVASSLPLNFICENSKNEPTPVGLPIDNNLFAVKIYDFDEPTNSAELMETISFVPKNYISGSLGYPTTIKLSYNGASVELTVKYE